MVSLTLFCIKFPSHSFQLTDQLPLLSETAAYIETTQGIFHGVSEWIFLERLDEWGVIQT